jgi:hypothetical protein
MSVTRVKEMKMTKDQLFHVGSVDLGGGASTLTLTTHLRDVAERYVASLEAEGHQAPEITSSIRCSCGRRVELPGDGCDVDCAFCGKPFNAFGQALSRGHGDCFCPECC